ncbi:serine hydrolase domain-containing protein [Aestuariivirga sp.]|jgi:CubicO group peptidase (beta-lactamase class C family)|uniref:serine hydrolase domain-containing protein n=1 Tax=Aestuariivirga sp. TaxID=2650926 RepID=UPI00378420AF
MSFRNLHLIHRRGLSLRAPVIWPLEDDPDSSLQEATGLADLLAEPCFCALVVVQDGRIRLERYAADFGPANFHSIQSITKTIAHIVIGKLVAERTLDVTRAIGDYVQEAGPAYTGVSVQQALDMDVSSNFSEDYSAPYAPAPPPGAAVGYARQEIAMGWRLPPPGEAEFGVRDFAAALVPAPRKVASPETLYASPNTDMLGWVIERVTGKGLVHHVNTIVEAAGFESPFHISLDCKGVPVLSGGGVMTARDLARYGLLLAQSSDFLVDTMGGKGTRYVGVPGWRYRNHLLSDGRRVGHPGYAGQFLMVDPERCAAAAFFSVLETPDGTSEGYFARVMGVLGGLLDGIA